MNDPMILTDAFDGHTLKLSHNGKQVSVIHITVTVAMKDVICPLFDDRYLELSTSVFKEYKGPLKQAEKEWIWILEFIPNHENACGIPTRLSMLVPKSDEKGGIRLASFSVTFEFR